MQWGYFGDSAWSFNRLEDSMALFTFMDLLLYMVLYAHRIASGRLSPPLLMAPASHGWTVDQLRKLHACSKRPDMRLQKNLMTLRTCCTPSDLNYRAYVVLFCIILLTTIGGRKIKRSTSVRLPSVALSQFNSTELTTIGH